MSFMSISPVQNVLPASSSNSLLDDSVLLKMTLQLYGNMVVQLLLSAQAIQSGVQQLHAPSQQDVAASTVPISLLTRRASQNVRQYCGVSQPPERSSEEASLPAACWLLGVAWTPCPDFPSCPLPVLGRRPLPFPAVSHNESKAEQRDKDGLVFF